jgi:hypothetical protein
VGLLLTIAGPARAERIVGLFPTGVDNSGVPLGDKVDDPHYDIVLGPADEPIPDETIANDGFPIPPWIPNDDDSRWIGPVDAGGDGNVDPGSLLFATAFDLTGLDPNNAAIVGTWATDNVGQAILLNGIPVPAVSPGGFDANSVRWFGINSLSAAVAGTSFTPDENVLMFQVENLPPGLNPAGLRIDNLYAEAAPLGSVPIPGLYNTGLSADGLLLADGAPDENYALIIAPDGAVQPATAVAAPPSPPWVSNTGSSRWIGPANDAGGNGPPGDYQFAIEFDLTGLDPATASITGLWSVDNDGNTLDPEGDILLNGVPVGSEQVGSFPELTRFDISAEDGHIFMEGANSLIFSVSNAGETDNPIGLRVEGLVAYAYEFISDDPGDFDADGEYTTDDIDLLFAEIASGGSSLDLTGDGVSDTADIAEWLVLAGQAKGFNGPIPPGDANLDGVVNAGDLNLVGVNWQIDDATSWSQGDFNADALVNASDLNALGVNWQASVQAGPLANTVPEPTSLVMLLAALGICGLRRKV